MSNWSAAMAEMDAALMSEFAIPVTLHLSSGDRPVEGIFDNPASFSKVSGGGYVADSDPELHLQDADASEINHRDLITVSGKVWMVTRPPEPDGTGMTKLTLGHHNGKQSSKPSIQY